MRWWRSAPSSAAMSIASCSDATASIPSNGTPPLRVSTRLRADRSVGAVTTGLATLARANLPAPEEADQ